MSPIRLEGSQYLGRMDTWNPHLLDRKLPQLPQQGGIYVSQTKAAVSSGLAYILQVFIYGRSLFVKARPSKTSNALVVTLGSPNIFRANPGSPIDLHLLSPGPTAVFRRKLL